MKTLFRVRLVTRGYPKALVEKTAATVSYKDRAQLLHQSKPPTTQVLSSTVQISSSPSIQTPETDSPRKLPPPTESAARPSLHPSKAHNTQQWASENPTLSNKWTTCWHPHHPKQPYCFQVTPLLDNWFNSKHKVLEQSDATIPRCVTCKHLNCSKYFTSSKTGNRYIIRQSFTCTISLCGLSRYCCG